MSKFGYLLTFGSLIVALAVSTVLEGVIAIFVRGGEGTLIYILWSGTLFLFLIEIWYRAWTLKDKYETSDIPFWRFTIALVPALSLFIAATIILQEPLRDPTTDLWNHYWSIKDPFLILVAVPGLIGAISPVAGDQHRLWRSSNIVRGIGVSAIVAGLICTSVLIHYLVPVVVCLVLVALVAFYVGPI